MWAIYDLKFGHTVAVCKTRKYARRKADRMDLAFGAIRYGIKPI